MKYLSLIIGIYLISASAFLFVTSLNSGDTGEMALSFIFFIIGVGITAISYLEIKNK